MKLPVIAPLSTKDGASNKNSRLTNMLKESKSLGDIAVVRPGLSLDVSASGLGHGLVAFNNELVSVYGSTLGFGVVDTSQPAEVVFYAPLNGDIADVQGTPTALRSGLTPTFSASQIICGNTSYASDNQTNDAIVIDPAYSDAMAFGTGDFTIEAWIYLTETSPTAINIFSRSDGVNNKVQVYAFPDTSLIEINLEDVGNSLGTSESISSPLNAWNHIALVRYLDTVSLYVNGVSTSPIDCTGFDVISDPGNFDTVICEGVGYWSDFRISNIAQYTGDFSPACVVTGKTIPALATITGDYYDFAQSPL